jgi:hypothetical protein
MQDESGHESKTNQQIGISSYHLLQHDESAVPAVQVGLTQTASRSAPASHSSCEEHITRENNPNTCVWEKERDILEK